jgi:Ribbon-helix-helix protein, copG family
MGQINVSADEKLIAAIDRVASARGLTRPDLLRKAMHELVEAHDGDRLAFAREEGPKLDASLTALAAQLREAVVELDRSQREGSKIAKRLIDASNGGLEAAREAERKLTERVNAHLRDGYAPYDSRVTDLANKVDELPQGCATAVSELLGFTEEQLTRIEKLANRQAQTNYYQLTNTSEIALSVLAGSHLLALLLGLIAGFLIGDPDIENPSDQLMTIHATPEYACRVVNAVFKAGDCRIPEADRKRTLAKMPAELRQ